MATSYALRRSYNMKGSLGKELSQLKQQMKQLQIQVEQQHPPRIQLQSQSDELSFRPVPALYLRSYREQQAEDNCLSPLTTQPK